MTCHWGIEEEMNSRKMLLTASAVMQSSKFSKNWNCPLVLEDRTQVVRGRESQRFWKGANKTHPRA